MKSSHYMRKALLRDQASNVRRSGYAKEAFKAEVEKSLRNKLGAKCTKRRIATTLQTIDELWEQVNCARCVRSGRLLDPPRDCPICAGRGYVQLG